MKTVVVGSQNPVKINITKAVFEQVFPDEQFEVTGLNAPSNVPDQPMSSSETKQGAFNRTESIKAAAPEADYWVGIEGGIEVVDGQFWVTAWMCIQSANQIGYGKTSSFLLPHQMCELIKDGLELGHAADKTFSTNNIKQKGGTISILTNDHVTRTSLYKEALIFALIPFLQPDLYN